MHNLEKAGGLGRGQERPRDRSTGLRTSHPNADALAPSGLFTKLKGMERSFTIAEVELERRGLETEIVGLIYSFFMDGSWNRTRSKVSVHLILLGQG